MGMSDRDVFGEDRRLKTKCVPCHVELLSSFPAGSQGIMYLISSHRSECSSQSPDVSLQSDRQGVREAFYDGISGISYNHAVFHAIYRSKSEIHII